MSSQALLPVWIPSSPGHSERAGLSPWLALGILITTAKPHLQIQLPSEVLGAGLGHINLRGHSSARRTPRRDLCKSGAGGWSGAVGPLGSRRPSAVPWVLEVSSGHVGFFGGSKHDMAVHMVQ